MTARLRYTFLLASWLLAVPALVLADPAITATPNPVGPGRMSNGTTTIVWHVPDGTPGSVYVSADGEPETLFATGSSGSQSAHWIGTASTYVFRLYREPAHDLVASVTVTRRDDAYEAAEISGTGIALLLAAIGVGLLRPRRAWLVEAVPFVLALAVLWITLVYATDVLRPAWGFVPGDRRAMSGTLALLMLIWAAIAFVGRRWRLAAATVVSVVVTTVAVADLVHARFYDDVMTVSEIAAAPQLRWVTAAVLALVKPSDGLYYLDCIALGAFAWFARRWLGTTPPVSGRARRWSGGLLLSAATVLAVPSARLIARDRPETLFSRRGADAEMGILPFHVYDLARAVSAPWRRRTEATGAGRADARRVVAEVRSGASAHSPLFGVAKGRNIILISAESTNAFLLDASVGGVPVMPHLQALARESLRFTNFYDQAHLGTTSDAEFLALESLYPLPDGPVATRFAGDDFLGMPTILARQGYQTLAAIGASAETWNFGEMHPRHGFQRSYFERDFTSGERLNGWIADADFFPQMAARLAAQPQPFMAFLLSSSAHFPYKLPPRLQTLDVGAFQGTLLGRYLQAAHYFDASIGAFIEDLRASGVLDRTVLAMYGDHHGYLDDPDDVAKLMGYASDDAFAAWHTRKRVPFLVRLPNGEAAGDWTATGGHLDIAPTLLALVGVDVTHTAMLGRDLTTGTDQLVVFRDGSFADGHNFYVAPAGASPLCYDTAGHRVDCAPLGAERRAADERLHVSDAIIRGNLVPSVLDQASR